MNATEDSSRLVGVLGLQTLDVDTGRVKTAQNDTTVGSNLAADRREPGIGVVDVERHRRPNKICLIGRVTLCPGVFDATGNQ